MDEINNIIFKGQLNRIKRGVEKYRNTSLSVILDVYSILAKMINVKGEKK